MATLPSKNALNDLAGGYYSYWTDGTTEGWATVAVLLGSADAQAAAETARASFGLVIGEDVQEYSATLDALAADPLTATDAAATYQPIGSYQPLDADLTAIAALSSADGNFIVGSATGWVAESGATARTSLGLGNVEDTALSTWAGSTNITTLGTIATGTVPAARVSAGTFQSGAFVFAGAVSGVTTLAVTTSATIASDLTLASGSITSASGAISFGNENLSTTGTLASGNATVTGTLGVTGVFTNTSTGTSYFSQPTALVLGTTATSSNAQFYATKSSSLNADFFATYLRYTQSAASAGSFMALRAEANLTHTTGTSAQAYAGRFAVDASGSGGTTTLAFGVRSSVTVGAGHTVGTEYVYYGEATNTGTVTTPWMFYGATAIPSYLAGSLRIGTTSAAGNEILRVNGLIHSDSDSIIIDTAKTPASAAATGTQGQVAWDSDYIYVCTATNTWKRVAIATWP